MSRADEIAQGLREPGGALIGGLTVEDYVAGIQDFESGNPPPKGITSTSYDLGRQRAREKLELEAEVMEHMRRDEERRESAMRGILADRPDLLADYLAKIAAIRGSVK